MLNTACTAVESQRISLEESSRFIMTLLLCANCYANQDPGSLGDLELSFNLVSDITVQDFLILYSSVL